MANMHFKSLKNKSSPYAKSMQTSIPNMDTPVTQALLQHLIEQVAEFTQIVHEVFYLGGLVQW